MYNFEELNRIINDIGNVDLNEYFFPESFIRLNMIYFSPFNLLSIREKFLELGLSELQIHKDGIKLFFGSGEILFEGKLDICGDDKIFSFELDFDPQVTGNGMEILNEIESFLKGCDAIFFMTYDVNPEFEVCSNPLSDSVYYLIKRSYESKKQYK